MDVAKNTALAANRSAVGLCSDNARSHDTSCFLFGPAGLLLLARITSGQSVRLYTYPIDIRTVVVLLPAVRGCLGAATFPSKLPLHAWGSAPHLTDASLRPTESIFQTASRLVQTVLHISTEQRVPILYSEPPSPTKIPVRIGYLCSHVIYGSLGQPESTTQTASRSDCDRLIDRQTED